MPNQIFTPFDIKKQYVIAVNGILPELDGSNLTNLPNSNFSLGWINTKSYSQNEFCSYNGKWYVSKESNNTNHTPTNTEYWDEYAAGITSITISDVSGLQSALDNKVNVVSGKGLSTNDFTDELATKLNGLNNYTLPDATTSSKGGVIVGQGLSVTNGVLSVDTIEITDVNGLQNALSEKIDAPADGSAGQVLKKTANGYEWSNDLTGITVTVDSSLSDASENPVQNKIVKAALDEKITAPTSGYTGQVLAKTDEGAEWIDVASIKYLLFKIPQIENDEYYQLSIEFSSTDSFQTTAEFNTHDDTSLFRVFTGIGMSSIQNTGLNYVLSDELLQMNIENIGIEYKYFRYHWTNDGGTTYGRYGYGNREAGLQLFDASGSDESPIVNTNKVIEFTSSNGESVSWNGNVATFTHNMNCIPVVNIFNESMEQVLYGIKVIDNNTITIDFKDKSIIAGTWKLVLILGMGNVTQVSGNGQSSNDLNLNEIDNSNDIIALSYNANYEIQKVNLTSNNSSLTINPCTGYTYMQGKSPTFEMWIYTDTDKTTLSISNSIQVVDTDNMPSEIESGYVYVFVWRFYKNNQLLNFSHKFIDEESSSIQE